MRTCFLRTWSVGWLWLAGAGWLSGQLLDYDSRTEPGPHEFGWEDRYGTVAIYGDAEFRISGGFFGGLGLYGSARGVVWQGDFGSIGTRDNSSLLVFDAVVPYLSVSGQSYVEVYHASGPRWNQAIAAAGSLLRLRGGHFDRVYTWPPPGGRIELGPNADAGEVTAHDGGVILQRGGRSESVSAASTGVAVLDGGQATSFMTASDESTMVIAGGVPPSENIRLFGRARVFIFHDMLAVNGTQRTETRLEIRGAEFDEPGYNEFFDGLRVFASLDGMGASMVLSAWNRAGEEWSGSVVGVRIQAGLHLEVLDAARTALLAFRVQSSEAAQIESSSDLQTWRQIGEPVVGTGGVHVEVAPMQGAEAQYFRLRRWFRP